MNRPFANGSALTLALSLRVREERRKRAEHSKRLFAEPTVEWFSLSLGERAGVRASDTSPRLMGPQRVQKQVEAPHEPRMCCCRLN